MGIKDWFGGDKKKAAFRDKIKEAVADGRLNMQVALFDQPSTRQDQGVRFEWSKPYEAYSASPHVLPENGAKPQGEANLIITNKRVVIKTEGGKIAAVRLGPQAQIYLYSDGLRLERTVGNTLLRFKSRSDETIEIVGELMSALAKR